MLWSPELPLMGAVQSLHLGRIGLAFLSKLLPYCCRECTFLEEILCAEQMWRRSTREPCRHQAVPVSFVKTVAFKRQGGSGVLKGDRRGNQKASHVKASTLLSLSENRVFISPGLAWQPGCLCFHSKSGWEVPLKPQASGISLQILQMFIACLRCARHYEFKGGS